MTAVDRYSPSSLKRMLSRVNSLTFNDESGEVDYFGHRVLMLRRDTFVLLGEELEKRNARGTGNLILGIMGRSAGQEEGKTLMRDVLLDTADSRSIPVFVKNAVEETNLGYGKLKVIDLDVSGKIAKVSSQNSFEAERADNSGCYFLLGYLEGLFSGFLRAQLRGNETMCRTRGDQSCVFELGPDFKPSKVKI